MNELTIILFPLIKFICFKTLILNLFYDHFINYLYLNKLHLFYYLIHKSVRLNKVNKKYIILK
jgi:hypothetical protein